MRVRYTPRARGDIDRIYGYLDKRSASGARNVLLPFMPVCDLSQNGLKGQSERMTRASA